MSSEGLALEALKALLGDDAELVDTVVKDSFTDMYFHATLRLHHDGRVELIKSFNQRGAGVAKFNRKPKGEDFSVERLGEVEL